MQLTPEEVIALAKFLSAQFVSYDDTVLIEAVRKIMHAAPMMEVILKKEIENK